MRFAPRSLDWWPGLHGLWIQGQLSALATALAFASTLTVLLAATLIRPDILPAALRIIGWICWVSSWLVAVAYRRPWANRVESSRCDQDLFIQAQAEYLRGDWDAAEATLERRLRINADDAETRLLLATLYRRRGNRVEAIRQLKRLHRLPDAALWHHEIQNEFELLESIEDNDLNEESSVAA